MTKFDLQATVHRLLTPQKTLAPWIFDQNNVMFEDVRLALLKICNKVVAETVADVEGLEVKDICLTGSSAGYFYHDRSDIDLRIEVHNQSSKELAKDRKHLDLFLATQLNGLIYQGYRFTFHKRLIDIKISSRQVDFTQLYSIKQNKWLIKPVQNFSISEQELIAYYQQRKSEILSHFEQIQKKYFGQDLGKALNDFYVATVMKSIAGKPLEKDYLVFKLLNYEHILKPIGAASIRAYNQALSRLK